MSKSIQIHDKNNNKIYPNPYLPIGSIYLSVIDTNPNKWFGGTWEQIAKGRTLVGVDSTDSDFNIVKKIGGSKYLQKHYHTFNRGTEGNSYFGITGKEPSGGSPYQVQTSESGTGDSGNLQPYICVYMWKRTA